MFDARLINDCFSDPGVYLKFKYKNEALLFDMGDLHNLSPRELLKIGYVFVSHTHMDHFAGFDCLLRICLGRDKHISLFGPPGFLRNIEGKISSYTWNLVENYTNDFVLHVTEVHETKKVVKRYQCRKAFLPETVAEDKVLTGPLADTDNFTVEGTILDHKIPSLAFSLKEKMGINIKKNALNEMELQTGKWLAELKTSIARNDPDETPVTVKKKGTSGNMEEKVLPLGYLKEKIVKITAGKKVSYITDAVFNETNAQRIVKLAEGSDIIFIEAAFMEEDKQRASEKYHLTARQAGRLAREAGAKNMHLFHFSPKYRGKEDFLVKEAEEAFAG
jgi:ribonuclease Z